MHKKSRKKLERELAYLGLRISEVEVQRRPEFKMERILFAKLEKIH